jgi:hypothetical protein
MQYLQYIANVLLIRPKILRIVRDSCDTAMVKSWNWMQLNLLQCNVYYVLW